MAALKSKSGSKLPHSMHSFLRDTVYHKTERNQGKSAKEIEREKATSLHSKGCCHSGGRLFGC